jgi:RNA polymerase sigma-32 factor
MTLGEVGRRFGISRERVRQLESRLKKRLQVHLRDVGGAAFGAAEA